MRLMTKNLESGPPVAGSFHVCATLVELTDAHAATSAEREHQGKARLTMEHCGSYLLIRRCAIAATLRGPAHLTVLERWLALLDERAHAFLLVLRANVAWNSRRSNLSPSVSDDSTPG
jgi:hypothetical protein